MPAWAMVAITNFINSLILWKGLLNYDLGYIEIIQGSWLDVLF